MTLTQLEYVLAIAKFRHFGRAADSCHVAQPSLSIQIQKLEEELGAVIFERGRSHFAITDAGQALIEQAKIILQECRRMEDIVQSFRNDVRGVLRLGVIPTIAPFLLPFLLPAVKKELPQLSLDIYEQPTGDLLRLIEDGDIDAAILSTPKSAGENLKERVLYYEPFVIFAAKAHPLLRHELSTDELENYPPHLLDETHCMRDQVARLCSPRGRVENEVQMRSGTLQTLIEIVNAAESFTLLPLLARESFRRNYPGQFQDFQDPKPSRKISLVFHRSFLKKPLIDALVSLIQRQLPKDLIPVSAKARTQVIDPEKSRFS